jgi:ankyrin repeat protein
LFSTICVFLILLSINSSAQLIAVVKKGDIKAIEALINEGADVNKEEKGKTPLCMAVSLENLEVVRLLLDKGADVNKESSKFVYNPLGLALHRNNLDIVRLLLDKGADVNKTSNGVSNLYTAVQSKNLEMVILLLNKGADVNNGFITKKGISCSPLYTAVEKQNFDMVSLLIERGADVNIGFIINKSGTNISPIALAVAKRNLEIAKLLIESGADINAITYTGTSLLSNAERVGGAPMIRLIKDALEKQSKNLAANNVKTIPTTVVENPIKANPLQVTPSDVDIDIPVNSSSKLNTYVLIIGNEDYSSNQTGINVEVNVMYAENDAKTFKEYCVKTLGVPEKNITLLINATGSRMLQNLDLISKISKANNGKAELIFYYAGHGLPDEQTSEPYLIPVDVSGSDLKYAVKLADVYKRLAENPAVKVTVFIDACFSGGARNESLLALRGVKVRPRENVFGNNLVVFTSSSGDESSASYKEKQHGMFTYYLLKKLQDTKGNCTYNELYEYLKTEISINSLVINKKQQTPQVIGSPDVQEKWKDWKMK